MPFKSHQRDAEVAHQVVTQVEAASATDVAFTPSAACSLGAWVVLPVVDVIRADVTRADAILVHSNPLASHQVDATQVDATQVDAAWADATQVDVTRADVTRADAAWVHTCVASSVA